MEKRALIAVGLAFLVLLAYQFIFFKKEPQQTLQQPATVDTSEETGMPASHQELEIPVQAPETASREGKEIVVETDLYSAVFSTAGGTLRRYTLKGYQDNGGANVMLLKEPGLKPPLSIGSGDGFELSDAHFYASRENILLNQEIHTDTLIFTYGDGDISVQRTYTFYNDTYKIDIQDEVSGLPDYWIALGTDFGIHSAGDSYIHSGPVLLEGTDREEFTLGDLDEPQTYREAVKWIAQEDKYFFASLVPVSAVKEARVWKEKDSAIIAIESSPGTNNFILYAGPKEYETLKNLNLNLEHVVDFGFFSIIAIPLFWVLKVFYSVTGNYGIAIILITLIIRIPFIPLMNKSQKSMKKMQALQPRMAEIREKYKKDPQRMQKELMELYKKHKVNPVGGCLPILLQIPVFFALYKILMISIELRQAPFMLWITDLSAPDTLFGHLPDFIPLIGGFAVGPLPILMGATMVIQQKMTPTTLDPTQNKLMMLMPIVFTFLFLNFASGLVLYWLMNNIFSIAQQFYVNKKVAKEKQS